MVVRLAILQLLAAVAALCSLPSAFLRVGHAVLLNAAGEAGKGASRCLRSALGLLTDGETDEPHSQSFLSYAGAAAVGLGATVCTAFHNKSFWTAAALLDLSALWTVWRRHKAAHAEAAASASVRRAAANPADTHTHEVQQPAGRGLGTDLDLPLLQCAAAHSKAAYGVPAASGQVSSAAGYLRLVTIGNATRKGPRHISAAQHLAALQQLTGCPPSDVLAAQWQSHLHQPSHYVVIDRRQHCIVVCVRGTLQLGDFCTVLDAVPQPVVLCGVAGHVHAGFMAAARNLVAPVTAALHAAAAACPGWPVLLTGHSLGGGVAAVLALLLMERRQQELEQQDAAQQQQQGGTGGNGLWARLGSIRCIGVGAAAAFCQQLSMACKELHVTSVLYGADCLPMFSVLGARLLIEEVHAKSKAAALVGCILRRTRGARAGGHARSLSCSSCSSGSEGAGLARTASAASSASVASSLSCEGAAAADSTSELGEIEEAELAPGGSRRLHRTCSSWSSASTASIAAFAADSAYCDSGAGGHCEGAALVPMFPPGRILWLLPSEDGRAQGQARRQGQQLSPLQQQQGKRPHVTLVETDQSAFERFLVTLETCQHHLPDTYTDALASLSSAP